MGRRIGEASGVCSDSCGNGISMPRRSKAAFSGAGTRDAPSAARTSRRGSARAAPRRIARCRAREFSQPARHGRWWLTGVEGPVLELGARSSAYRPRPGAWPELRLRLEDHHGDPGAKGDREDPDLPGADAKPPPFRVQGQAWARGLPGAHPSRGGDLPNPPHSATGRRELTGRSSACRAAQLRCRSGWTLDCICMNMYRRRRRNQRRHVACSDSIRLKETA